jgi:hypothetical protein
VLNCHWLRVKVKVSQCSRSKNINTTKYIYYKGGNLPEEEKKQLVTSLRVDSALWKEAKVQAIRNDLTLTELVEEAINLWMQEKMIQTQKIEKK